MYWLAESLQTAPRVDLWTPANLVLIVTVIATVLLPAVGAMVIAIRNGSQIKTKLQEAAVKQEVIHTLVNSQMTAAQKKIDGLEVTVKEMRDVIAALVPARRDITQEIVAAVKEVNLHTDKMGEAVLNGGGPASHATVVEKTKEAADQLHKDVVTTIDTAARIETKVDHKQPPG